MFSFPIIYLVSLPVVFRIIESISSNTGEIIEFHEPSYCAIDEYFNVNQLKCFTCDSDKNLVPSRDGLTCVCNERSKIKKWNFASFPICELCKENELPTRDQLDCISCSSDKEDNFTKCEDFRCPANTILVDRTPNGELLNEAICLPCSPGTEALTLETSCNLCKHTIITGNKSTCSCQEDQKSIDGVCFKDTLKNWPDEKSSYTITYDNGKVVDSQFLRDNLLRGVLFCKMGNQTLCQLVGNMCSMLLYKDNLKSSPCSLFSDRKRIPITSSDSIPWLYYGEGEATTILSRKRISARFNLNPNFYMSYLNLTGIIYYPDGRLKTIKKIDEYFLQMYLCSCKPHRSFRFAAKYSITCHIPPQQFLEKETEFVDLYLRYKEGNEDLLYAVPILILNLKHDESFINKEPDRMQWQLVRRFFLVDKISGFEYDEENPWSESIPKVLRYAKTVALKVKLQGAEEEGKIFVPFLEVEYGELTREEIEKNNAVTFNFLIAYEMDNNLSHALEVSIGVFSGLAIVWSAIRTWSHSKRSGCVTIDFILIIQLILFTCGNLANVFFLVIFGACLNYFIFFKGQSVVHLLLPTEDQEEVIKLYIIFAFLLKIVEIAQIIFNQISIDIFFIDWERPRARNLLPRLQGNQETEEEQPVSSWRTYFVANEWNEIQAKRKLNINIHLVVTIFMLKVIGLENWAAADPDLSIENLPVGSKFSFTCRFAVGGLVYLVTYGVQRLFMGLIYERYVKNGIQEFVDLCSMANISVFILAQENYGYYIHGRSAHGFADTDMHNIIKQLQREEDDLVGHRGLLPGTDQQTFEMTVPAQLRNYYKKVMAPLNNMSRTAKRLMIPSISGNTKMGLESVDKSIQAYHNMNRFLAAFLEHALKDLDYEVRDKVFMESLLGIEFSENSEKGVFYSDKGHSFDEILFYGNEFSLLTFDVLLFSFVLLLMDDYLLAVVITAIVAHLLVLIRNTGGRKNLAKKTLIDERFLI